jgi:hypothetical protein
LHNATFNIQVFACVRLEAHRITWNNNTTSNPFLDRQGLPSTLLGPPRLHNLVPNIDVRASACLQVNCVA